MIYAQHGATYDAAALQPPNSIGDRRLRNAELARHIGVRAARIGI
jgi:hypothetical protein